MRRVARCALGLVLLVAAATLATAQVAGVAFHDRNGNGIEDPGEEALAGVTIRMLGRSDAGATVDTSLTTAGDGAFSFAPGNGCYVLSAEDPAGWRRTVARFDARAQGAPGYTPPAGVRRYGGDLQLMANLKAGTVRYTSMGDSIAWNWNSCFDSSSFWYSLQVRDRLRCVAPAASINLDQSAVKGSKTEDLLTDDGSLNNVFGVLRARPQLVTISIIGNDLLGTEPPTNPTQDQLNRFVAELIDSRTNIQEIVSSLVAGLPGADVELNTLYDNKAYACATNQNHQQFLALINFVLRDIAWGQARRVTSAEIYPEFAHQDLSGACTGFQNLICNFLGDGIHPKQTGYNTIREKLWEALDGVNLGPKDGNAATSITGADHGYLKRVLRLYPTASRALNGATVTTPEAAFREDDGGAGAVVRLGTGSEDVRFSGFPSWYDEVTPVRVVAGVKYRTTGTVTDDFYRVEASVTGTFRPPPGFAYTPTNWNFYTPLVGTGGPNMPVENADYPSLPSLVVPNVPDYRTVTALLTKNPVLTADGKDYVDPPLTRDELGTAEIRVASAPVANTPGDDYRVVVDAVWLDVYGTTKPRPAEIANLAVTRNADGGLTLAFDTLASSQLYNLYTGSLATLLANGTYDFGTRTRCNTPVTAAGPARQQTVLAPAEVPAFAAYFLVTGRVDGVESPAGYASNGSERDRSQSTCP